MHTFITCTNSHAQPWKRSRCITYQNSNRSPWMRTNFKRIKHHVIVKKIRDRTCHYCLWLVLTAGLGDLHMGSSSADWLPRFVHKGSMNQTTECCNLWHLFKTVQSLWYHKIWSDLFICAHIAALIRNLSVTRVVKLWMSHLSQRHHLHTDECFTIVKTTFIKLCAQPYNYCCVVGCCQMS